MVEADVGDHGHEAVGHVGGIPSTAEADFDHRRVHRPIGEPAEPGPGDDLEPGEVHVGPEQRLEIGDLGEQLGQLGITDRLAVGHQPFVDSLEVRAGEGSHREALGHQQGGQGPGGGRLAVGPGQVDDRRGILRVAEDVGETLHPRRIGQRLAAVRQHPLEVLVAIQPRQGVAQLHQRITASASSTAEG